MGLHEQAEQMFYMAQQINPDCALCYYNIGNSLFARGQYKKAIHCWMKTYELEPSHPQINYHIAQALWAEDEIERSRQHFLKELRINPGDVDVIVDFGLFLLDRNEIDSAKEKFNRVLELKPDMAIALFYLGEIALNAGDQKKATELFKMAMERDACLPGPRYRLALACLSQGDLQAAKTYLASEAKLAADDADVLVSLASAFLVIAAQSHGKYSDTFDYAINCLLRAIDADPCDTNAHYYLGLANAMNNRPDDAAEFFTQALDINPQHVLAIRDLACVYLAMHRPDEAAKVLESGSLHVGDHAELKQIRRKVRRAQIARQLADLFGHNKH
jgi:superkiller protein 3